MAEQVLKSLDLGDDPASFADALAKVVAHADGEVRFGENKVGVETLSVSEIDPIELADRMGERKWGYEAGWGRAYPYVATYDKKIRRFLRGEAPELQKLAADVEDDYPARRGLVEEPAQRRRGPPPLRMDQLHRQGRLVRTHGQLRQPAGANRRLGLVAQAARHAPARLRRLEQRLDLLGPEPTLADQRSLDLGVSALRALLLRRRVKVARQRAKQNDHDRPEQNK